MKSSNIQQELDEGFLLEIDFYTSEISDKIQSWAHAYIFDSKGSIFDSASVNTIGELNEFLIKHKNLRREGALL